MSKETQQTLFLSENADLEVKIHPVVLFSILDSYLRRPEGQVRVIGTLLGTMNGNVMEVTNSFAVPHLERDEEVAVGKDFNHQMFALHQNVNSKEQILGWYATSYNGVDIVDNSSLIHDFYTSECDNPVHLVVDTSLRGDRVGVKAYVSSPVIVGGEALANVFHEVKAAPVYEEAERICLDRMARGGGGGGAFEGEEGNAPLAPDGGLGELEGAMEALLGLLDQAGEYVAAVLAGKEPADEAAGRELAAALAAVPRLRPAAFDQLFATNLQDLLMVSYLTNLARTQMAIAEKLNETMS
ncbi:unnamed protein product [Heterosigma akashiwo]|mmetsp:Transcript_46360/g.67764  ORF Transcript_46360/g.67764 Transcript_46360/m.67764 type:complete len:298 (+) Transcript_46360:50-943(+)